MLRAFLNPLGVVLLLTSLVLAGLVLSVLDRWSGQAIWIFLIGLIAYGASTAIIHSYPAVTEHPNESTEKSPDPINYQKPDLTSPELRPLVEKALQQLNRLPILSQSELIHLLPRTLAAVRSDPVGGDAPGSSTPLENARALQEVIIAAIGRLSPPADAVGAGADQALEYHMLREAYVEDKPVAYILTHYSIADSTYYRHRRNAVSAIANDLSAQENLLR